MKAYTFNNGDRNMYAGVAIRHAPEPCVVLRGCPTIEGSADLKVPVAVGGRDGFDPSRRSFWHAKIGGTSSNEFRILPQHYIDDCALAFISLGENSVVEPAGGTIFAAAVKPEFYDFWYYHSVLVGLSPWEGIRIHFYPERVLDAGALKSPSHTVRLQWLNGKFNTVDEDAFQPKHLYGRRWWGK